MQALAEVLRRYPELAIFLTLALGFLVGGVRLGKFSLGNVTGVLLAGVLIGQLHIDISPDVKSVFFLMFLFAVGYGVGPQFFRGLKGDGLPQVFFAVMLCVCCLICAVIAAKVAGYDVGHAAGLLAGACTISAVLGVAADSVNQLPMDAGAKRAMVDAMPVAYAVTYLFGTAGSAWFLASVGPRLLGVDLAASCREYEAKLKGAGDDPSGPGVREAYRKNIVRAYRLASGSSLIGKTVAGFESAEPAKRLFVERLRRDGNLLESDPAFSLQAGDIVAIAGAREILIADEAGWGVEVDDPDLLRFPVESLDVVITNKALDGLQLGKVREGEFSRIARGVFLRKLMRGGQEVPFSAGTVVDRGDVLTLEGAKRDVERTAKFVGYADRPTDKTDVVFMGFGIVLGGLLGALSIRIGGVPVSLSTSGGALLAGLVCGWLRSVHRTFGRIPSGALWAFNNMGLTIFIAVVGITTGPSFVSGLRQAGAGLFLWGVFVTIMPFVVSIYAGKYLFKMHPAIILGACAGARTTTAALGAIQDEAKSKVPALGYTITYAVGNTLLIIWGVVIVFLMK